MVLYIGIHIQRLIRVIHDRVQPGKQFRDLF